MNATKNFFSMVFGLVFWAVILGAAWKYVGAPYFKTINPTTAQVYEVRALGQEVTDVGIKVILERTDGSGIQYEEHYSDEVARRLAPFSMYYTTNKYIFKEDGSHAAICSSPEPEKIDYTEHCARFNHKI